MLFSSSIEPFPARDIVYFLGLREVLILLSSLLLELSLLIVEDVGKFC